MTSSSDSRSITHTQDITAIYDIIWHASTHPSAPLSVQTTYSGSRILFRKQLVPTHSLSVNRYGYEYEYRAVLKFEGWEVVYGCDESLFQNFDILSLPAPSTFQLSPIPQPSPDFVPFSFCNTSPNPNTLHPQPLLLTFTNSPDDEGYPLLHFEIEASTEMVDARGERLQMCAVGWAKRREFDDEVPGVDTCLSAGERERLAERGEVDMVGLEREGDVDGLEEGEVREWG